MQSLVYIFIALSAVGIAVAAYFGLTFSPIEAAVTALAFAAVAIMLMERRLRLRSEARLEKAVEDLARLLSSDAKAGQVLSQRVNAMEDANVADRLEAVEADISVLGTVVRQVAEAVAELEDKSRPAGSSQRLSDERLPAYDLPDEDELPQALVPEAELRAGIDDNRLVFHIEPLVVLPQRRPLGYDLVPRLMRAEGALADAPDFMPRRGGEDVIRRIEAMALDEGVTIARRSRTAGQPIRLYLPLTRATVTDTLAMGEVLATLGANQAVVTSLLFVVPAAHFKGFGAAERRQLLECRKAGARFVLTDADSLRLDYAEMQGLGFTMVRFDATRFLRRPEAFTDFHTSDISPYVRRFEIELCGTGVVDEQQLLSLLEDGIRLAQGPHVGRPGPVRSDLVVERSAEPRRIGERV